MNIIEKQSNARAMKASWRKDGCTERMEADKLGVERGDFDDDMCEIPDECPVLGNRMSSDKKYHSSLLSTDKGGIKSQEFDYFMDQLECQFTKRCSLPDKSQSILIKKETEHTQNRTRGSSLMFKKMKFTQRNEVGNVHELSNLSIPAYISANQLPRDANKFRDNLVNHENSRDCNSNQIEEMSGDISNSLSSESYIPIPVTMSDVEAGIYHAY
ncbi:unnamed protein product [Moneuplotes crassus]|uniref:Uncharacterized protein n=1 Tax=Euplotes crassus TaxID=5936 RepID=A0AAD2D4H4_EUPCR|nr:unnamed protein product [Moneuplotes crassus]